MNFVEIINLIDHGRDSFYTHISFDGQKESGELQFINHRWQYRQIAYQGEWFKINSPQELKNIDYVALRKEMVNVLLTEYCYWEMVAKEPNELRKQKIKNFFGERMCNNSLEEMKKFQEALVSAVKNVLEPRPNLTIVKE